MEFEEPGSQKPRSGCVDRCPGCRHRDLNVDESERQKASWLASILGPELSPQGEIASLRGVPTEGRWGYRDKVCLRAEWGGPGAGWKLGFRVRKPGEGFDDEVIDIPECPVHSSRIRAVHRILKMMLPAGDGFPLAFVLLSGALLTLVIKAPRNSELETPLRSEALRTELLAAGIDGAFINFNSSAGNRVLSHRGWVHLWGEQKSRTSDGLWYGPDSFQQLIPRLYQNALDEALAHLDPRKGDQVLDLYSGAGASIRKWQDRGALCLGVELGGEAVECATLNLAIDDADGASAVEILRGRASDRIPQIEKWLERGEGTGRRLLFTNPPRLGMEESVTHWIGASYRPEQIAYLSCSAGTLARDLSLLRESGYAVSKIIPYDFFPNTHHVETLALLERLS